MSDDLVPHLIVIPDDVEFADLHLARDADGHVSFAWDPIARICAASGIDPRILRNGPEDNIAVLTVEWYMRHRAAGGEPDPVQEDLIREAEVEDERGDRFSHPPGRA